MQGISILFFGSSKPGIVLYTILMLPGTIIHEISHWLVAELLQVPTGEITILPDPIEQDSMERKLGSVMTAKTDPIRGFLIGMAPLIVGTTLLMIISVLLGDNFSLNNLNWYSAGLIYAVIVLGNSMLVSRVDRRHLPFAAFFVLVIYLAFTRSGLTLPQQLAESIGQALKHINDALLLAVIFELAFISILLLVRKSLERIRGRKIVIT